MDMTTKLLDFMSHVQLNALIRFLDNLHQIPNPLFCDVVRQEPPSPLSSSGRRSSRSSTNLDEDESTTLMIHNLSSNLNQRDAFELFSEYHDQMNFFYLPTDISNRKNLSYCFINFSSNTLPNMILT